MAGRAIVDEETPALALNVGQIPFALLPGVSPTQTFKVRRERPRVRARQAVIGLKRTWLVRLRRGEPRRNPSRLQSGAGRRQLRPHVTAFRPQLVARLTSELPVQLLSAARFRRREVGVVLLETVVEEDH